MNCREFETMAHDLARDRETDATTRQSAALHSEHCAGCARRLADERSLATGLRSLAANVAHREAPPRVEAALLEAFRGQSKAAPSPAVTAKRGFPLRLRWVAAAAAAAAALLIFALSASRIEQQMPSEEIQARENKPVPTEKKDKDEPTIKRDQKTPPKKKRLVLLRAHLASNKTVKKKPATDQSEQQGAGDEIATRFLPFTSAGSFEQMDGGQLVRVEIPRSALVSFGLPMNIERADERIKADVLIGNDGVARAIRFVR
jgi:hypothetical protein